jgi:hypothetical protein
MKIEKNSWVTNCVCELRGKGGGRLEEFWMEIGGRRVPRDSDEFTDGTKLRCVP